MKLRPESVTIIGNGALGTALIDFFRSQKTSIKSVWNSQGGEVFRDSSGTSRPHTFPNSEDEAGEMIFITTPDSLISDISKRLSEKDIEWKGRQVVHCSGALASSELKTLNNKGAAVASMHPIQTFRRGDTGDRFKNITVSLEGDSEVTKTLENLAMEMGATPVHVDPQRKRALHLAAVMASNYLVALMHGVEEILENEGVDGGISIFESLIRQTVENIFEKGTVEALSGPVARGDYEVIKAHLEKLNGQPHQKELYRVLSRQAIKIAEQSGGVDPERIERMRREM
ncbi:MAG: DUF2520 domain-containing protein [Balneolaceae bacterium]|nr:DUF2520 domain-containing protein [Balneolaceae bacterium]MCH8550057.1 DUF2520 domain-containing protein [Balneolaceae bacterium]